MRTQKNALIVQDVSRHGFRVIRWENARNIGNNDVFTKISCLRHRGWKTFTPTVQKSLLEHVEIYNGIMTQAHLIAQKWTEWQRERAFRRVKEGTATALLHSWQPEEDCAMECFCYLRNVHDKVKDPSVWTRKRWKIFSRLRATCGRRLVRWHDDSRFRRFARIRSLRHPHQKIQKNKKYSLKEHLEFPCASGTSKDFVSVQDHHIDSGGQPRARRWCWNQRRRQKKEATRKIRGPCVENLLLDIRKTLGWICTTQIM